MKKKKKIKTEGNEPASPLHWGNHLQAECALNHSAMKDFTKK